MNGHNPCSELTKCFTPENLAIVEAGTVAIIADSDQRERGAEQPARPSRVSRRSGACGPPSQISAELGHDR